MERICLAVVLDTVIWYIHCRIRAHDSSAVLIHITSHWNFFFFNLRYFDSENG